MARLRDTGMFWKDREGKGYDANSSRTGYMEAISIASIPEESQFTV